MEDQWLTQTTAQDISCRTWRDLLSCQSQSLLEYSSQDQIGAKAAWHLPGTFRSIRLDSWKMVRMWTFYNIYSKGNNLLAEDEKSEPTCLDFQHIWRGGSQSIHWWGLGMGAANELSSPDLFEGILQPLLQHLNLRTYPLQMDSGMVAFQPLHFV